LVGLQEHRYGIRYLRSRTRSEPIENSIRIAYESENKACEHAEIHFFINRLAISRPDGPRRSQPRIGLGKRLFVCSDERLP